MASKIKKDKEALSKIEDQLKEEKSRLSEQSAITDSYKSALARGKRALRKDQAFVKKYRLELKEDKARLLASKERQITSKEDIKKYKSKINSDIRTLKEYEPEALKARAKAANEMPPPSPTINPTKQTSALDFLMSDVLLGLMILVVFIVLYSVGSHSVFSFTVGSNPAPSGFPTIPVLSATSNGTALEFLLSNEYGYTIQVLNLSLPKGSVAAISSDNCTGLVLSPLQKTICYLTGNFGYGVQANSLELKYSKLNSSSVTGAGLSGSTRNQSGNILPTSCQTYVKFHNATSSGAPINLTYTVNSSNSFVALMIGGGEHTIFNVSLPTGCSSLRFLNDSQNRSTVYIAVCNNQAVGNHLVRINNSNPLSLSGSADVAVSAYVFSRGGCNYAVNAVNSSTNTASISLPTGFTDYFCAGGTSAELTSFNGTIDANGSYAATSHTSDNICAEDPPIGRRMISGASIGILGITSSHIFNTTFSETGLPSKTLWKVNFAGENASSTSTSIVITSLSGVYSYNIPDAVNISGGKSANGCGNEWIPNPSSGREEVGGSVSVAFSNSAACITQINQGGLPNGYVFNVTYDGIYETNSTSNNVILFTTQEGTFNFTAYKVYAAGCVYYPYNLSERGFNTMFSGQFVAGNNPTIGYELSYCLTAFSETGLPTGTDWNITYNGTIGMAQSSYNRGLGGSNTEIVFNNSENSNLNFLASYGYIRTNGGSQYCINNSSGDTPAGTGVSLAFAQCVNTTFIESGLLPPSAGLSITYDGVTPAANEHTSRISLLLYPGTYTFSVDSPNFEDKNSTGNCTTLYSPTPSSGDLVAGNTQTITISHITYCPFYFLYASNWDNGQQSTVSAINAETNTVADNITTGSGGQTVTISSNGKLAYVANYYSNSVTVINTTSSSDITNISLGGSPEAILELPNDQQVYVALPQDGEVAVINTTTNSQAASPIPVGSDPYDLVATPNSKLLYVGNDNFGTISVINTTSKARIASISVGTGPANLVSSPNGQLIYSANYEANTVSVINTTTNDVITTINNVESAFDNNPMALSSNGKLLYIAGYNNNSVTVINTTSDRIIASIPVGSQPEEAYLLPNGKLLYVSDTGTQSLSVINTSTNQVVTTLNNDITGYSAPGPLMVALPNSELLYVANPVNNIVSVLNTTSNTVIATLNVMNTPSELALG